MCNMRPRCLKVVGLGPGERFSRASCYKSQYLQAVTDKKSVLSQPSQACLWISLCTKRLRWKMFVHFGITHLLEDGSLLVSSGPLQGLLLTSEWMSEGEGE